MSTRMSSAPEYIASLRKFQNNRFLFECGRPELLETPSNLNRMNCYMRDPDGYLIEVGEYTQLALDYFKNRIS